VTAQDEALDRARPLLERELSQSEGRTLGLRVTLLGSTPLHTALAANSGFLENLRALAQDVSSDELWIEKLCVLTTPPATQASLRQGEDPIAELLGSIDASRRDTAALADLARDLGDLRTKLPAELREGEDALRLEDPEFLAAQLGAVEQLLLSHLLGERGET
jgi:exonuclease SbcD